MTIRYLVTGAVAMLLLNISFSIASAKELSDLSVQPGYVRGEYIYETAPFPSCHASTILETPTGLLAAWFGGTEERHPDVGIWTARYEQGRWSAPVEVANGVVAADKRYPTWNPVLFRPTSGPILLFYKVGPSPSEWWGMVKTSTDNGRTWSAAKRLPDGILGPIKNKPVQLANGDIISPTSSEHDGWRVHFEISHDQGVTWKKTPPVNDGRAIHAIQPSILIHSQSKLQALGRTRSGQVFQVWSADGGNSWEEMTLTSLPNPSAGTDAVTLADGRHLIVYNHTPKGRSPLNVAMSSDGVTWEAAVVLENSPGLEFSYPAVIQTSDGLVHITYTWKRERIKHAVLDPSKLVTTPLDNGNWPSADKDAP